MCRRSRQFFVSLSLLSCCCACGCGCDRCFSDRRSRLVRVDDDDDVDDVDDAAADGADDDVDDDNDSVHACAPSWLSRYRLGLLFRDTLDDQNNGEGVFPDPDWRC